MDKSTNQNTNTAPNKKQKVGLHIVTFFAGVANGFFGGGGGMFLVPAFKFLGGMQQKESQATAMSVILPLSVISAGVYMFKGNNDFATSIPVSIGVLVGGVVGAFLLKKLSNKFLSLAFYILMIVAGIKLLMGD